MTTHNNKPEEDIEKCFEEIKAILEKHNCIITSCGDCDIALQIKNKWETNTYYTYDDFNKQ